MTTTTAREYLRVSLDKSGRERSIDEQHDDNRRDAEAHGWTLGEPYRDRASASRYAKNGRNGYDRLIADLEADRFAADVLVIWESSRGSRRVSEWARLIDLCEDRGVLIHVTAHGRTYDPTNYRDRATLHEDATDSERESGKISSRVRRALDANGVAGTPHGRVPYGYVRRYDERNRRLIAQEEQPAEAAIVRELFDRLRRGHSLRSIAADFERRGVRNHSGRPFSTQHLRAIATRATYAGDRIHHDKVAGKGTWPALVDRETFLAVRRILTAPERVTTRPGRAVHLLSMIALCDVCGGPLAARGAKDDRPAQYQCHRATHVRGDYAELNALAEKAMLAYLSRPDNVERLTADAGSDERLEAARLRVAEISAELDDLGDQVGRGELSARIAARAEPAIQRRLEAAQREVEELATPPALRDLISPGTDVARRWKAAPMSAKREVARLLLAPDVLGELRLARAPAPGQRVPVAARVLWRTA